MTPASPASAAAAATPRGPRGGAASVRVRILGWYVVLLGVSLIAALLIQRTFLLAQEVNNAESALDQEVAELRQLASGMNPSTGEPFGTDVAAIFDTFFSRNVPLAGEGVVTFVAGEAYKTDVVGSQLAVLERAASWANVTVSERGAFPDDLLGEIRYIAVPVGAQGEPEGVFVVAVLTADRLSEINQAVRLGALVYGSIFLLASVMAWVAAGRILHPLRELTDTARSINETDISRRIDVEGDDEIAELGRTFNSMLDRLGGSFASQRRFIDDASHELRTPITVIRGNLEVMGDQPEDRRDTLAIVTDELDRMARIVDDLLDLAKAEQPDFIQRGPVDLGELTHELAAKAAALDDRPWTVEAAEYVVIDADRHRLNQAMMNLLRNAAVHTPSGTPVHLGSRISDDSVELWVRDEGPGVLEADRERIFDRFARAELHRTEGAGLGLAIVAAIAEGHGGTVRLDPADPSGCIFTISLPMEPTGGEPS